jgi:starch synthase
MRQITYFLGGSVGSDPYGATTWSGISANFLRALDSAGLLDKAVGLRLTRAQDLWFRAKNYNASRAAWRKQYYMDLGYRRALTNEAGKVSVSTPVCLQIGSMFCLPDVFPDRMCFTYQDGNLASSLRSGFGLEGVSRASIDGALQYEEQCAQKLRGVFTFSEYLRQSFIRDYHVAPERVFNVGGAINLTTIPEANPEKDYSVQKILFIGIDAVRKGCNLLLEAFGAVRARFPKAELHIVGPSHLAEIPPGVVFHGKLSKSDPVQRQQLESLLATATLFVLPSLYEPFGIAPLEAMLYETACILTDDWAFREFVTPGVNGELVIKGSVEDLAAKMESVLSDPVRLAEMGRRGREIVLSRYTWDAVAARVGDVLHQL